jgi:2,4-dienoyl-CoA reductase-like NADH-dependent reductase (Old Yellow Enzyme family)/thioredoxin reductase
MDKFQKLFEPGRIGPMRVKNRIVMAPMQTFSYEPDGTPNQKTIDYFVTRAAGGVGLIICPGAKPSVESQVPGTPSLYSDNSIPSFKKLADAVHTAGARIAHQINHTGKALTYSRGGKALETVDALSPSPMKYVKTGITVREASLEDIRRITEQIAEAARRVRDAGFDMVELHAAHGYFLSSFLSPYTNRRSDQYGGTPEKRARFLCEVIEATRKKVGSDFPIGLRISGSDFLKGGTTIEDTMIQARLLVDAGATCLHVSAGAHENTEFQFLSYLWPDGYLTHLAAHLKKVLSVPIITVGKLGTPEVAERVLREGQADFVALGRPLLADPDWAKKVYEKSLDKIYRCISCNNCWKRMFTETRERGRLFCIANPALLCESQFYVEPSIKRKNVLVIGGGLAGLAAAHMAARRNHDVELYESRGMLGGQWSIACLQPGKEIYRDVLKHLESAVYNAGVKVTLNTTVTPELVRQFSPDAVVLATGSLPRVLDIPGIDGPNVVQAIDVIQGSAKVGQQVIVIGGRLIGMELSIELSKQGKTVFLLTAKRLGENGDRLEENIYRTLRDRIIASKISVYPGCPVLEIRDDGAYFDDDGNLLFLEADTVVLAVGAVKRDEMLESLRSFVEEIHVIGDCLAARDGLAAVHDGTELGMHL